MNGTAAPTAHLTALAAECSRSTEPRFKSVLACVEAWLGGCVCVWMMWMVASANRRCSVHARAGLEGEDTLGLEENQRIVQNLRPPS